MCCGQNFGSIDFKNLKDSQKHLNERLELEMA